MCEVIFPDVHLLMSIATSKLPKGYKSLQTGDRHTNFFSHIQSHIHPMLGKKWKQKPFSLPPIIHYSKDQCTPVGLMLVAFLYSCSELKCLCHCNKQTCVQSFWCDISPCNFQELCSAFWKDGTAQYLPCYRMHRIHVEEDEKMVYYNTPSNMLLTCQIVLPYSFQ